MFSSVVPRRSYIEYKSILSIDLMTVSFFARPAKSVSVGFVKCIQN